MFSILTSDASPMATPNGVLPLLNVSLLYSTAKDMFSHGLHFCPRDSNQLMNSTLRMLAASCLEEGHYSEALGHLNKLMTLNNEEWVEDDDQGGVEKARTLSLRITILLRAAAESENNESHMRAAMIDLSSMEAIRVRLPRDTLIQALLMELYHRSISSSPLFASEVVQVLRKEVQNLSYEEILGNTLLGFDARMRRDNIQLALDELVWGCRTIAQLPLEDLRKGGKKDSKPLSALINQAVDIGSRASRQFQWKEAHGAFAVCLFLHDLGPPCNATWSRSALTACASFSLIRWHILLQSKRSADVCYEPLSAEGGRFFIKPAPSFPTSRSLLDISLELLNRSDLAFSSDLCSCRFMTLTLLNDGEGQKRVVKSLLCHQNLELLTSLAVFCLVHQSEPSMGQALLAHVIRMSKEGGSMLMAVRAARILLQKPTLSTPAVEVVTAAVSHLLVRMEAKCGESEAERKWLEARIADKKSSMILEAESQSREREVVTGTP